jgi:hypothetical protein
MLCYINSKCRDFARYGEEYSRLAAQPTDHHVRQGDVRMSEKDILSARRHETSSRVRDSSVVKLQAMV